MRVFGYLTLIFDHHSAKKKFNPNAMKKTVLTFGLISGAIISAMFMITMPLYKSGPSRWTTEKLSAIPRW